MNTLRELSCRLCFRTDGNFEVIDDITRDILSVVPLELKLDESKTYVMCVTCSGKLKAALEFTSICLATGDTIYPYIDCMEELQLDLKEIYMKEIANKDGTHLPDDQKICSLCLQPVDEFVDVREEEVNAIHKFVPEMNMGDIKDPVACKRCFDSVNTHNSFLNNCIELEKRIGCIGTSQPDIQSLDASVEIDGIKTEVIKFEEIQIKSEDTEIKSDKKPQESDTPFQNTKDERVDCTTECVTMSDMDYFTVQMYKCALCNYKTTKKDYFKDHELRHKDIPEEQMYKCQSCDYKTGQKKYFRRHELKHKNIPEDQMYKCDLCDYKAKRKDYLVNHQRKHKDVPAEQMHKCDLCDYKTIYKHNITQHQQKHKVVLEEHTYKCDSCEYKTVYRQSLVRHQLKHKDVPLAAMFKCDLCDYKSIYKNYLTKHQLKHKVAVDEQMYKCDWCDFKTTNKKTFTKHQPSHKSISEDL